MSGYGAVGTQFSPVSSSTRVGCHDGGVRPYLLKILILNFLPGTTCLAGVGPNVRLAKLARRLGAPTRARRDSRVLARAAAVEFSRAASSMDRLHIELLATRPLDFRDAPCFAATCTVARTAILSGPLLLWTDIERMITVAQLERLLQLIAWCGHSVRSPS